MITEDCVSFETAKLLKEKGFNINSLMVYSQNGNFMPAGAIEDTYQVFYAAPTLQMAMRWLEEVHHILVIPDYVYEFTESSWNYKIYRLGENGKPERCVVKGVSYDDNNNPTEHITGYRDYELSYKDYGSRQEAEDEGIRYVLEKYV